ncbi:uncharacterized protein LOC128669101 [Plodia interpunctella]|uniref:uncharacterized protein LOC128669101 n=1 Tax=Plodia interpunctella TaxID=58824 RepID=UPI002367E1E3|nr:uncharacterized protein LOC128669101 [Plodia interpunctella]XP_053599560.1 uncharacterized protein LOC128669101 [Plodia interpunctella]
MPVEEAPLVELGSVPQTPSVGPSPSPSEISSASSPEPQHVRATPLFRALAMPPPEPVQPPGQDELERRLPGYRRIVIPRDLTLIELLKQCGGVMSDEEVLRMKEAKLRVVAERVGLRRLHVLTPRLRKLVLDGSAIASLRDLGIGLVKLKILSVNRCGLTTLDGVWGLGALRELYASGNKIQELQPLAALQKLQILNLADNPIQETSRLWTLGICSSLRRLTLSGTAAAESPNYRTRVASALPMLMYLDERPLHTDIEFELDYDLEMGSSGTDTDVETDELAASSLEPAEQEPGPSSQFPEVTLEPELETINTITTRAPRRRPATTECAGSRPRMATLPVRPRTAHGKPTVDAPTRLQILNTLMDEEWRCSGSKLTSCQPVCGNLARALRRPLVRMSTDSLQDAQVLEVVEDASRALADEIPRAPRLEDWVKFQEETGIEIDIDFTKRPPEGDSTAIIDRLERIEKETSERLSRDAETCDASSSMTDLPTYTRCSMTFMSDFDSWKADNFSSMIDTNNEVEDVLSDINFNIPNIDSGQ